MPLWGQELSPTATTHASASTATESGKRRRLGPLERPRQHQPTPPATVYESGTGSAEVFAIAADGTMAHTYSIGGGPWSAWSSLGAWKFKTA
ncbi:hypothetical protein [Embleya hyalina]|uniref:hypothetical protein n=1 Tax=Embleya hyalina TaxID=516124 RepID=UPI000F84B99C|nr:hypothetical protein [Embleya hyalina]